MPGIFNVTNGYTNNTKKISSKLTFDVGEKFSGRIVKNSDGEVKIRLLDGWEFPADVEGDISNLENILQRFTVEGYENGKLKLKLISNGTEESATEAKDISDIISKEGLKKDDEKILNTMIKFNIPLTKENIKEIKGMMQFLDKIQDDPEKIDSFILKYLESNGIDISTDNGRASYEVLNKFFSEYSTLTKEDLLMFFENNIELNSENIEAYNNLAKSENNIDSMLKDIKIFIDNSKLDGLNKEIDPKGVLLNDKGIEGGKGNFINNESIKENLNVKGDTNSENKLVNNIYQKNEISNSKVNMLSLLKTLAGESEDMLKGSIKDILSNRKNTFTTSEYEKAFAKVNSLESEDFIKDVKNLKKESDIFGKTIFKDEFDEYLSKSKSTNNNLSIKEEVNISKGKLESLLSEKVGREIKLSEGEYSKLKDVINIKYQELEEGSESISKNINNKDIIQNKEGNLQGKENINNKSDLDNKAGLNNKEIINSKDGIENKDVINNKNITNNKDSLSNKEVINNKDLVDRTMTTKEQVSASLNKVSEENKSILKDVIKILNSEGDLANKLLSLIKENISEVKVFNKLSEEYYYANIPVKVNNEDYPCKIIVKDKRKDGKKLDSKNLKMIVTIDTNNIGKIEGYLTVLERKLDIDLKCDENYVKILNIEKDKLSSSIENMGFSVNIKVIKKEEDVSISTCRDFFNTGAKISLDRRV